MSTSFSTSRNIIKVVNTFYIKWNMISTFNKSQISTWILNFRKIYNFAVFNVHCSVFTSQNNLF